MLKLITMTGSALLIAAPYLIHLTLGKAMAIAGLALLTVQAIQLGARNLVLLNCLGIVGYTYSIIGSAI